MNSIEQHLKLLNIDLSEEIKKTLQEEKFDYEAFLKLEENHLITLGFKMGERIKILDSFKKRNDLINEPRQSTDRIQPTLTEITNQEINGKKLNNGQPISGHPIKLIGQENGKLVIYPEALGKIHRINGTIAVCSVVGPFKSGKSFILNQLLNRQSGFEPGKTNVSCTRGIWMWDTPIENTNKHGHMYILFLDTEGLNSLDSDSIGDNRIFVLSLLLSSFFVYNTKDVIDREAIRKLAVMTQLADYINSSTTKTDTDKVKEAVYMKMNLPGFVWVVRDFFLENCHVTPNKYLSEALKLEDNTSNNENIREVNLIRESIQNSFKSHDCYLVPTPIEKGTDNKSRDELLKNLDKIEWSELREDFRDQISDLCKNIKENITCKSLFTTPMSGPAFSAYIESVVEQMNENKKVSLIDSLLASLKNASEVSLKDAILIYEKGMDEFLETNQMPVEWKKLNCKHDELFRKGINYLEKNLNGQNEVTKPFFEKFSQNICIYERNENNNELRIVDGKWAKIRKDNCDKIKEFFKIQLNNLWIDLFENKYLTEEAKTRHFEATEFKASLDQLKQSYQREEKFSDGPEKDEAYNEWYNERDINNVLANMQQLSDEIKQSMENERKACEERGLKERAQKETNEAYERWKEDRNEMTELLKTTYERHENTVSELRTRLEQRNIEEAKANERGGFFKDFTDTLVGVTSVLTGFSSVLSGVKGVKDSFDSFKPNSKAK